MAGVLTVRRVDGNPPLLLQAVRAEYAQGFHAKALLLYRVDGTGRPVAEDGGDVWTVATANVTQLMPYCATLDVDGLSWTPGLLEALDASGWYERLGWSARSGWCKYPVIHFNENWYDQLPDRDTFLNHAAA